MPKLREHTTLEQSATDAQVTYEALAHLSECNIRLDEVNGLVRAGRLPEAIAIFGNIDSLFKDAPEALKQSDVMSEMKV